MADRKRFLFVVPVFAAVYAKPFANFLALMLSAAAREHDRYEFIPYVPERKSLPAAMNSAAEIVITEKLDGMIMADDDCQPPYAAVSQLLRRYETGKDIVLALGFMRDFPYTTTVGRYFPEGLTLLTDPVTKAVEWRGFEWIEEFKQEELPADGLFKADFGGFPIGLVTREALEQMERPWFGLELDGGTCTHDVYFGRRASDAGIPVYVDLTIPCGHLSNMLWITFDNRQVVRDVNAAYKAAKVADHYAHLKDHKPSEQADGVPA